MQLRKIKNEEIENLIRHYAPDENFTDNIENKEIIQNVIAFMKIEHFLKINYGASENKKEFISDKEIQIACLAYNRLYQIITSHGIKEQTLEQFKDICSYHKIDQQKEKLGLIDYIFKIGIEEIERRRKQKNKEIDEIIKKYELDLCSIKKDVEENLYLTFKR